MLRILMCCEDVWKCYVAIFLCIEQSCGSVMLRYSYVLSSLVEVLCCDILMYWGVLWKFYVAIFLCIEQPCGSVILRYSYELSGLVAVVCCDIMY